MLFYYTTVYGMQSSYSWLQQSKIKYNNTNTNCNGYLYMINCFLALIVLNDSLAMKVLFLYIIVIGSIFHSEVFNRTRLFGLWTQLLELNTL